MSDSTSNLDLVIQSQSSKEITINALADAGSPSTLFGRRQSFTSGLQWGYYGGRHLVNGVPTAIANGTLSLAPSRTQQIEAGQVSTSTTAITGITIANPCVISVASHPFAVGDAVWIDSTVGTTELNKSFATVQAVTATTITLNLSSVGFTAWSSGGTLSRVTTTGPAAFQIGKGHGPAFVAPLSLYQVATNATTVTSYTDFRVPNNPQFGRLTKSVAGSANVVLTRQEADNEQIELTGALTGNIALIFPPSAQGWQIVNNTSGAFTVTARTPVGTGVIVAQSVVTQIFCDGLDIKFDGSVARTNIGQTFSGDQIFSGKVGIGTAAPAQLLHVEGNLSGGNGINALIRNTSASGSAGLHVQNNSTLLGGFSAFGTSYGVPSLVNTAGPFSTEAVSVLSNSSVSGGGTGSIKFIAGGYNNSPTMTIKAGNPGSVGIGTTAPTANLHIKAGTATANTAPLKLTSGVLNTTPESGTIEFDGINFYMSI